MERIILGSRSPRRKEILSYFSIPFEQATPPFDETSIPFQGTPEKYVCSLSHGKGLSLSSSYPHAIILTADSIVFRNGKVYEKPKDKKEAFQMLQELSGQWHTVYTGVTLMKEKTSYSESEATQVLFNSLTETQIRHYHNSIEWGDKAGAYGIQGRGGLIVHKIEGCFYNVMGLPLNTLSRLFSKLGIDLWHYLG